MSFPMLECGMRSLAFTQAVKMQPWHDHIDTWVALQLGSLCGQPPPSLVPILASVLLVPPTDAIWVCPDQGSARGTGEQESPLAGLHAAVRVARARKPANSTIVLKGGVHYLGSNGTLHLGAADNGLLITSAPGERAWLSGGKLLSKLVWKR